MSRDLAHSKRVRALFLNPNPRSMSLIQPVVALFHSILESANMEMKFFDTTYYDLSNEYVDPQKFNAENLTFKKAKNDLSYLVNETFAIPEKHLKQGFDLMIQDLRAEVMSFQPDIVLLSTLESTAMISRRILESIRDFHLPHVIGGCFPTFAPELAIEFPEVDFLCVGEAENTLVPLIDAIYNKKFPIELPGIWYKDPQTGEVKKPKQPVAPLTDLNSLPKFDTTPYSEDRFYRAMSGKIYRMFPVETHRGCNLTCSFCNSPLQNTFYKEKIDAKYFRKKAIPQVMDDVRKFVKEHKAEFLFFWADNFLTYTRDEIDEFCEMYSEFRIPFYVQSYPATLDEVKVQKLFSVGLKRVGLGVEHGNEEFRKKVVNRNYTNATAIEKMKILQKFEGLEYSCNNIVGFPNETPELHMDTVRLNRQLNPHSASCSIFTPFYGTPLREICLKEGFIKDNSVIAPTNSEKSILNMPNFTSDQILGKARTFNLYLKFPENRWKEIEKAEQLTPEGDRAWNYLKAEYEETYA
jgi:anaerobic magnesium-protoporphyrin IX monomethyl ester cyclase